MLNQKEICKMIKEYLEKTFICKVRVEEAQEFRYYIVIIEFTSICLKEEIEFLYSYNLGFEDNMFNLCNLIYTELEDFVLKRVIKK